MSGDVGVAVERALGTTVEGTHPLDGGQVGSVHRVDLADGRTVVAKTGRTPLTVEARMLRELATSGLPVPDVSYASDALLVLEHVAGETGAAALTPAVERDVARRLAALHDVTAGRYGFPFDTLSGPAHQPNPWTDSWVTFFRDHRLLHVARTARDEGSLPTALFERLEQVAADLPSLLPDAPPPSLCHGDVWASNLVVRDGRVRAFLDPACAYEHAETDLAYADWVGFGDAFFEAYADERAIDAGFREQRCAVYALVPILEHVAHFDADRYRAALADRLSGLRY